MLCDHLTITITIIVPHEAILQLAVLSVFGTKDTSQICEQ